MFQFGVNSYRFWQGPLPASASFSCAAPGPRSVWGVFGHRRYPRARREAGEGSSGKTAQQQMAPLVLQDGKIRQQDGKIPMEKGQDGGKLGMIDGGYEFPKKGLNLTAMIPCFIKSRF